MPNIPKVPGVPPLTSYGVNSVVLLAADIVTAVNGLFGQAWGVYLNGLKAFPYQSILDFDYRKDSPVSDYPVEKGGFFAYDKVEMPFDVKVRLIAAGSDSVRGALIDAVQAGQRSLNLYDVVTPERTYAGCNITHVDYKKASTNGVSMIVLDVWMTEIRETSTANFSNTKNPGVAGQQNTGNVTAGAPLQLVDQNFDAKTWSLQ